ncbi:MAG: alpha/beta hydrolase [Anaerolineaceae bacterium]|nr:alpha/beta hydrolase [Anaerolineaceae bacterium]
MTEIRDLSGFATLNNARIYYEVAGQGQPLVMIHAGIADSRQWNNEFAFFSKQFRVLRYDLRGYGKSEPVDGEFSHLADLTGLLEYLNFDQPLILMGCSMGGGLAMDFALTHPAKVKTLIMVGSGPTGLELDVPAPAKFEQAEQAWDAGDLDLLAEIEIQIWFDGQGRSPDQVNQAMRSLAYEMNRHVLSQAVKLLGKQLPDAVQPAVERLSRLTVPVLVIIGSHDTPYILAAADYMLEKIPLARKVIIDDAAHLANMDQPQEFQHIVSVFLNEVMR